MSVYCCYMVISSMSTPASEKRFVSSNLNQSSSILLTMNHSDYLFRAYSLDQGNPMINMSVGLCYIQYAMKRQTGSRPYVIMQGISFMQNYYDNRKNAPKLEEREEAHYNMARTYHMLGLSHLAIPFYLKVLSEAELTGEEPGRDDLVVDAAYNLQTLYSVAGNAALAKAVTEKWLVI